MTDFLSSRHWTQEELIAAGFTRFKRKKQVVMARVLPSSEAPRQIETGEGDVLVATEGYYICYMPGDEEEANIEAYHHWPVEPEIFQQTYREWDEADWTPSRGEAQLLLAGCKPYYKVAGVWAKELTEDVYLQSLEHEKPVLVRSGKIVAIGAQGEPYSMGKSGFEGRYTPTTKKRVIGLVKRMMKFFKTE